MRAVRCDTCIYGERSRLDLEVLEDETRDANEKMTRWRQCHHHDVPCCCRGFWDARADECEPTKIAKLLGRIWPERLKFCIPEEGRLHRRLREIGVKTGRERGNARDAGHGGEEEHRVTGTAKARERC